MLKYVFLFMALTYPVSALYDCVTPPVLHEYQEAVFGRYNLTNTSATVTDQPTYNISVGGFMFNGTSSSSVGTRGLTTGALSSSSELMFDTTESFTLAAEFIATQGCPSSQSANRTGLIGRSFRYGISFANTSSTVCAVQYGIRNASDATSTFSVTNAQHTVGQRYVYAMTWNTATDTMSIFRNGALLHSTTSSIFLNDTVSAQLWFGDQAAIVAGNSHRFNGIITHGWVYNRSISQLEATQLNSSRYSENGLVGDWQFTRGNLTCPTPDSSCSYSGSGDWTIDLADSCTISSSTNLYPNKLNVVGAGTLRIASGAHITAKEWNFIPRTFNGLSTLIIESGAIRQVKP